MVKPVMACRTMSVFHRQERPWFSPAASDVNDEVCLSNLLKFLIYAGNSSELDDHEFKYKLWRCDVIRGKLKYTKSTYSKSGMELNVTF